VGGGDTGPADMQNARVAPVVSPTDALCMTDMQNARLAPVVSPTGELCTADR